MSRASVLARGRAAAEAGMTDTCIIERDTVTATNPETGAQTIETTTVYSGPCRVQQRVPGGARDVDPGEAHQLMLAAELQLPVEASAGVRTGDRARMTSCANDPDLVGRQLRIRELGHKSEATARRMGIQEAT